jgi:glycosyltransferase involved in cell wall biosynthesis
MDRDPVLVARLRRIIQERGLAGRVSLVGDLDEHALALEYSRADLFVLPTYYEGYGMAVAEALARGLPVISTATGAIPDLIGKSAGMLVPPGDAEALATALARFMDDPTERARMVGGAHAVRDRLPGWQATSDRIAAALTQLGTV